LREALPPAKHSSIAHQARAALRANACRDDSASFFYRPRHAGAMAGMENTRLLVRFFAMSRVYSWSNRVSTPILPVRFTKTR
jgi:hypothetical protein